MPQRALEIRVENLENTVANLARLPQQMQDLRGDISASRDSLRSEMHVIRDELRVDMASMHKDLANAIIANGVEMRALHEAAIERIKLLGETIRPAANASPPDNSR